MGVGCYASAILSCFFSHCSAVALCSYQSHDQDICVRSTCLRHFVCTLYTLLDDNCTIGRAVSQGWHRICSRECLCVMLAQRRCAESQFLCMWNWIIRPGMLQTVLALLRDHFGPFHSALKDSCFSSFLCPRNCCCCCCCC